MRLDLQDTLAVSVRMQIFRQVASMNSSHTVQVCSVLSCLVTNYTCRLTNEPQLRSGSDATPPMRLMAEISARSWGGMSDAIMELHCEHHMCYYA
jgi:hypothetical protein